jgi:uncharacterized protein YndB with AHSA1/START domain
MMTAAAPAINVPVLKTVTVKASVDHAFKVFTEGFDGWWPRSHHIGKQPMTLAVLEPKDGGRCYGRSADGTDADWGRVIVWEPPRRLVIAWQINADWQYEPDLAKSSEVEIRFTPESDGSTRVDLEHRHFERHGAGALGMRTSVDSPNGWGSLLKLFVAAARTYHTVTAPLAMIFTLNDGLVSRALDGVDESELWLQPTERTNGLLWVVGHLVQTRAHACRLLGADVETGWADLFERGAVLQDRGRYPSREAVNEMRSTVLIGLLDALASLSGEQLARPASGPRLPGAKTVADQIAFFALHDSYHVGQLSYIRKALGKSGIAG